ncbi:MAG: FIST C-terminal domain-containing protein [Chloroflexi bacterium]|nr:FIST C-terminal domain-containing protein [Chloroflexota bacterium]
MATAVSGAGAGTGADWRRALGQALAEPRAEAPDVAFLFASSHFRDSYPELVGEAASAVAPGVLMGCSGQAVIGTGREFEGEPALTLMTLSLPGAHLKTFHIEQGHLHDNPTARQWHSFTGLPPDDVNAWVVFADPFTFDTDMLIASLAGAYPGVPLVGGMASAFGGGRGTELFLGDTVHRSGAILLALGGAWSVRAVVSQGAAPIGSPWTITDVDRNLVRAIGGRPPLEVLVETMHGLSPEMQARAARNLLVGLAIDEYRESHGPGDFLIRNLMGADQKSGIIAIGEAPRVGQTLQFQVRDAAAADAQLREMIAQAQAELAGEEPAGALLCSCNGRGVGLFGEPDHDARAVERGFGRLPVAGFFCNGEIGPVGGKNFVHGFTASIAFFVPAAGAAGESARG